MEVNNIQSHFGTISIFIECNKYNFSSKKNNKMIKFKLIIFISPLLSFQYH